MATTQTLRHVPWTCRWGQFGGAISPAAGLIPGFVFWVCDRPQHPPGPRPLNRNTCETCVHWEAIEWPCDTVV
jgi:myo-inositol catabolism protein IolC